MYRGSPQLFLPRCSLGESFHDIHPDRAEEKAEREASTELFPERGALGAVDAEPYSLEQRFKHDLSVCQLHGRLLGRFLAQLLAYRR